MVKGESISYRDIEPRESKIPLLPINPHEYMNFSGIHYDDDGESNLGKLNKDDEKFLKNYFEKKKWVFKNKGKGCEFDDLYDISEDEKEIKKQEKFEAEFGFDYVIPKPVGMYSCYKKHRTEGELKKVKSGISWQRLVRKIKKGEPISYGDIEPCETKFLLLYQKCTNFSDDDDGESNLGKLNKDDDEKFLKNYVEKKQWLFKNKEKSCEFDDNISEDEKEIKKQEKYESEFNSLQKKNRTEGELKKVKSEISRREIKKGEPISYSDIEPCESKFILLPIKNFSDHDENDEETELRKLRKLRKLDDVETMFLKNYVEKKRWYFKNKRKSREVDDLDYIPEDEKGIKKQERYAEFSSPYDLREYALQFEPVAEENGDRMQVVEVNGDTGKSSKKRRRNGGLEECKTSKERRKAYGLGDIGTNNKKKNNGRRAAA